MERGWTPVAAVRANAPARNGVRVMAKQIFDCFMFYNEVDLLEMRLAESYQHVDKFVIVEASVTFQGGQKPLYFQESQARFARFLDKIILVTVTDMPGTDNPWAREEHQRAAIWRGLGAAQDGDIIVVSDVDEMIRQETYESLRQSDGFFQLVMPMYQYFMNLWAERARWNKAFAFTKSLADRMPDFSHIRTHQDEVLHLFGAQGQVVQNAGWHFTYLGGPQRIRDKLRAFSHSDGWHAAMLEDDAIEAQIAVGYAVGGTRGNLCTYQPIGGSFPRVVVANQDMLLKAGYIRDPYEALRSLQNYTKRLHREKLDLQQQYDELLKQCGRL